MKNISSSKKEQGKDGESKKLGLTLKFISISNQGLIELRFSDQLIAP